MPITAAAIEADGWVLRLDITASLGSFADYLLDPNGAPRLTLTSSHPGFVKSGGQAVAGTMTRTLVATKPLRKPANWTGSSLAAFVVDETDLGGGAIRVRIALSEHVYATDTGLSLAVAAGWRTGEAAVAAVAVTNNSALAAPIPIMRWTLVPYNVVTGSFTVAIFVASHHPVGFEPVAGVKFTATDGSNVKTVWTTALSTDTSYGDNLRCYTASIDPATATALTQGLLRCDAEVYPWLGAMRTTDTGGVRSMTGMRQAAYGTSAASPFVVAYDPAGTRYSSFFTFVDPVSGTTTASAAMIQANLAAAKAVAPASRPRNISTAVQAMRLANRTLAPANGQAGAATCGDGLQICLAAGTHSIGTVAVSTGMNTTDIGMRVFGDPANSNPRANVILQADPIHGSGLRITRMYFDNLTIRLGGNVFLPGVFNVHIDRVTIEGKDGFVTDNTGMFSAVPAVGNWNLAITRSRYWRYGAAISSGNTRMGLFRANEFARSVGCYMFAARNRIMSPAEDATGATSWSAFLGHSTPTVAGDVEDIILAYNDARHTTGRFVVAPGLPAATAGTPNQSIRRNAWIGNIVERIGPSPEPFTALGEDSNATMTYNIIEANSFVGDRANLFYSDPVPTSLALVDTQKNQALVNRIANNVFDWLPSKHDAFNDPAAAAYRGTANGYRPQMIEAWSMVYGVCHEGNVDANRDDNAFQLEFSGLRSLNGYAGALDPHYSNDRSLLGSGTGGGDYRPRAASPLVGRGIRGNGDVDADGRVRQMPFTAGAFQAVAIDLLPHLARSVQSATPALLTPLVMPGLQPASGRLASRAGSGAIGWTASFTPASGVSAMTGAAGMLSVSLALQPAGTIAGLASTAPSLVASVAAVLSPGAAHHRLFSDAAVPTLLPGTAIATLIIGADPRTLFPFHH